MTAAEDDESAVEDDAGTASGIDEDMAGGNSQDTVGDGENTAGEETTDKGEGEGPTCCKVERLRRSYDLGSLDEELIGAWTGEAGQDRASLRDLERELNRRLIAASLASADSAPIDGEAENLRRLLRSGEVTESRRIEARRRLDERGVDPATLEADFVSHGTIHSHLRECCGVSRTAESSPAERRDRVASTVYGLANRTERVTGRSLDQLVNADILADGDFDVLVDVQIICESCGKMYDLDGLLEAGGCTCSLGEGEQ